MEDCSIAVEMNRHDLVGSLAQICRMWKGSCSSIVRGQSAIPTFLELSAACNEVEVLVEPRFVPTFRNQSLSKH